MLASINSFPLMAVPFFVLVGQVMNAGGITDRIFKFANTLVGNIQGGLGHVNIIASLLMSGMSGSAVADASGLGQVEIRAMIKQGYDRPFAAAITAASATIGPIIPPSIPLVIFGSITGTSISQLLLAGIIPGVLMGLGLMVITWWKASQRNYPTQKRASIREVGKSFVEAFPAIMTPAILVGGILSGIFTPTEAAGAAAIYAIFVALFIYREISIKGLFRVFIDSSLVVGAIFFIIGAAAVLSWLFTWLNIPQSLAAILQSSVSETWMLLLLVNLFLLCVGCFLEANAGLIFTAPLLYPMMTQVGVDPVHFGVILVMNLMIGLITPPIGLNMYIVTKIANINALQFLKGILPFGFILIVVLLLITFVPKLSLLIPSLIFR
jgi:tripartite ATP-independent transporter DctM subunit